MSEACAFPGVAVLVEPVEGQAEHPFVDCWRWEWCTEAGARYVLPFPDHDSLLAYSNGPHERPALPEGDKWSAGMAFHPEGYTPPPPYRLPIYGETERDIAIKDLCNDWNFGQWLFGGRDVYGHLLKRTPSDVMDFFWSIDSQQDPYSTTVEECLAWLRRSRTYDDPDESPIYLDEEDGDDQCEDGDAFDDEFGMGRCDFAELVHRYRDKWLRRGLKALGMKATSAGEPVQHVCRAPLLTPIEPWPEAPGVYFVIANDRLKIGTAINIKNRLGGIQSPYPLKLVAFQPGGRTEEKGLHDKFKRHRTHGEWFRMAPEIVAYAAGLRMTAAGAGPTPPADGRVGEEG